MDAGEEKDEGGRMKDENHKIFYFFPLSAFILPLSSFFYRTLILPVLGSTKIVSDFVNVPLMLVTVIFTII